MKTQSLLLSILLSSCAPPPTQVRPEKIVPSVASASLATAPPVDPGIPDDEIAASGPLKGQRELLQDLPRDQKLPRAKALYYEGRRLFAREQFAEAAYAFELDFIALPKPIFLYNAGQAWRRAGNLVRAMAFFKKYLFLDKQDRGREEVESEIAATPSPKL